MSAESFGIFNPKGYMFEHYPGGSLQWVLDREDGTPFSRLFEQARNVTHIPADKKINRK